MNKQTMQLNSDTDIKDDLGGAMSIRFTPGSSFAEYCATHIENYDAERFEVMAVRFYYGKEIDVTVYAVDKAHVNDAADDTVPVKKFKLQVSFLKDILPYIEECNFTLTTGDYPLASMRVTNK
jgi:hypothetical protein